MTPSARSPSSRALDRAALHLARSITRLNDFPPARSSRIVFIVGSGRSGTTALMDAFRAGSTWPTFPTEGNQFWHPAAYPWHIKQPPVLPIWSDPVNFINYSLNHRYGWPIGRILRTIEHYGVLRSAGRPSAVIVKSVMINFMLREIVEVAPKSRFVVLIRDGRDVALSYAKKTSQTMTDTRRVYEERGLPTSERSLALVMAEYWQRQVDEFESLLSSGVLLPMDNAYLVRYEELCSDEQKVLAQLADFLDMPFDPKRITPFRQQNANREMADPTLWAQLTEACAKGLEAHGYTTNCL